MLVLFRFKRLSSGSRKVLCLHVDWADVADKRYDQAFNSTLLALSNELIAAGKASKIPTTDQQHVNGRLALSANHSYSALTLADAMAALERLKDKPFTITASFEAPHPPFIVPYPFYNMCTTAMLSRFVVLSVSLT